MEIRNSYLVKLINGTQAWLSVDKETPDDSIILEERPILIPSDGMVLHKKGTDEYSHSTWLRDTTADEWEEITQEEYEEIIKSLEEREE